MPQTEVEDEPIAAEQESELTAYQVLDETLELMERGTEISAVFHKEIVLSEHVVSPNKEQGELSFDPGGPMKFVSNSLNLIEGGDKEKIEPQLVAFAPNLTQDKEALCSVDGSLIITARHMPYTGNGFKLFANSGGIYDATYTAAAEASLADLSTSQNVRKVTNDGMLGVANAPSPIYMASVGGEQLWRNIAPAPRLISGVGAVIKDGGISKGLELKEEAQLYRKSNTQFRNVKEGPMGRDKHFYRCFGGLIFDPGGSGSVYVASSSISFFGRRLKLKLAHFFDLHFFLNLGCS